MRSQAQMGMSHWGSAGASYLYASLIATCPTEAVVVYIYNVRTIADSEIHLLYYVCLTRARARSARVAPLRSRAGKKERAQHANSDLYTGYEPSSLCN